MTPCGFSWTTPPNTTAFKIACNRQRRKELSAKGDGFKRLNAISIFNCSDLIWSARFQGATGSRGGRQRLGCLAGTFSPTRRQIRSTRLWLTTQPAVDP